MMSLDTETTGLDLRHGAKPFFVTTCRDDGTQIWWEWDVDPETREPNVDDDDLNEIRAVIRAADRIILQNTKFDVRALEAIGVTEWDWSKVEDTLIAGHMLASNQPHDLTSMAMLYLGINIEPYEKALGEACNAARRYARSHLPDWRIAKAGLPEMPSAKDKTWKIDSWLPRALAKHLWESSEAYEVFLTIGSRRWVSERVGELEDLDGWEYHPPEVWEEGAHPWWTVLRDYANADSSVTVALWKAQEKDIRKRKLWSIYRTSIHRPRIAYEMESVGVTVNGKRLDELEKQYTEESAELAETCVAIAARHNYDLIMPKGGNNKSLRDFCFGPLSLPKLKHSKTTGEPSLDKEVMGQYESVLPPNGWGRSFIRSLRGKRQRDTAIAYMGGYRRFWLPYRRTEEAVRLAAAKAKRNPYQLWYVLYPNLNPTGTDTLRWSSSNPNGQNLSKQEGFNLRYCFGPAPGREWWSLDAKNIELRLPAYESGEKDMIDLFERPDDPPYFGSNHLLVCHILHPEKFEQCIKDGVSFKDRYKSSWYQWVKNGNFAITCGAIEESGTADRAYHVPGGHRRIKEHMQQMAKLSQRLLSHAQKYGYVETMPDKTVDPERGYPLMVQRTERGQVLPTTPFSYHVQGTAMWWMMKAQIRCSELMARLNKGVKEGDGFYMILQVHDELLFDFPRGTGPEPWRTNLPVINEVKRLMEMGGDDIGVPTPVSCEYHTDSWSKGISV